MLRIPLVAVIIVSIGVQALGADVVKPVSPRALEIRKMKSRERDAVDARCRVRANWQTPDCMARREAEEAKIAENNIEEMKNLEYRRGLCADGNKEVCKQLACPGDGAMMMGGSAEVAKTCSRFRKLPFSAQWAQIGESRDERRHEFFYLCLEPLRFLDPYGVTAAVLPEMKVTWKVTADSKAKRYEAQGIENQTFATKEAAVTAGCPVSRRKLAEFFNVTPIK